MKNYSTEMPNHCPPEHEPEPFSPFFWIAITVLALPLWYVMNWLDQVCIP